MCRGTKGGGLRVCVWSTAWREVLAYGYSGLTLAQSSGACGLCKVHQQKAVALCQHVSVGPSRHSSPSLSEVVRHHDFDWTQYQTLISGLRASTGPCYWRG